MECFVGFFELLHQRADGGRTADDNLACRGRRLIFSRLFGDVLLRGHNRLTFGRENPVDEVLRSRGEVVRLVSDVEGTRDGVITAGDVFGGRFDVDGFRTIFGVARHLQRLHGRIHRAEGDVADGSNVLRNRGLDFGRAGVHSGFDGGHINPVAVSVLLLNARQFDERGARALLYFLRKNNSSLQLCRTRIQPGIMIKTCTNGSSEFMTNISMSLVNMLYNFQLMRIAGENGIAAYGVIMYVSFIFCAMFIGYSVGCAPLIGYNYGAENYPELKNLFHKSLKLVGCAGVCLAILANLLSAPLASLFVGYDDALFALTVHGFRIYSLAFLLNGFSIFGSAFFTALNNGLISACIAFLRTFAFQIVAVLVLPYLFGINGVWCSIVVAESLAICVTISFFVRKRHVYHYA